MLKQIRLNLLAKKVSSRAHIGKWQKNVCKHFSMKKNEPMKEWNACEEICTINPMWKQPRVVIVGAGMAGLSAAQRLLQCGLRNFLILEATDRPGGRIHTRWMGDSITEMGAMYIEGASNQVLTIATQEGIMVPPLQRFKLAENATFYTADGRTVDKRTAKVAVKTFEKLVVEKAVLAEVVGESKNLGEFIENSLKKELKSLPVASKEDMLQVIGCLYNELSNRIGQDPSLVRSLALAETQQLPGGRTIIPPGFGSVLAPLLRILPASSIKFCKPIDYIKWSGSDRAVIVCTDKEEFYADYVIITVSLGVLKQESVNMFRPELPEEKMQAIQRLGFADVERIFMQYEEPFWVYNDSIGLAWPVSEPNSYEAEDWTRGLGELTRVPNSYATLQGTVSSHPATILSSLPSQQLIPVVGDLMRKFTGDETIPDPINVQHSTWSEDRFFKGAYTYLAVQSDLCHLDQLAAPIPNTDLDAGDREAPLLLFAGEATSREYFATVHGARETGIREAQRIIDLTNYLKGPPHNRKPSKTKNK